MIPTVTAARRAGDRGLAHRPSLGAHPGADTAFRIVQDVFDDEEDS